MIINTNKDLRAYCEEIKSCPFITVDTEFLREKTYYPLLCLIQVGKPNKDAVAIDPLAKDGGEDLDLTPLLDILYDQNILKIFHAARQDLEIIYNIGGKVVSPIFDTQIAAMVCGYGEQIGYNNLVNSITDVQIDKSSQFTDWSRRPLSEKQINYALGDVTHLVDVYKHLEAELEKRGRTSWVKQEEKSLTDPALYDNDPKTVWERVKIRSPKPKTLAMLRELAAWREEKAQHKNIPKNWVMRDETLADLATQAPRNVKKLEKIRNMPKGIANGSSGKMLIEIINRVSDQDHSTYPKVEKKIRLSPHEMACADVLKLLLKVNAAKADVATKLIASKDDLYLIASEEKPDIPAMKGWRYDVFGEDALKMKRGKLALTFCDGDIVKKEI